MANILTSVTAWWISNLPVNQRIPVWPGSYSYSWSPDLKLCKCGLFLLCRGCTCAPLLRVTCLRLVGKYVSFRKKCVELLDWSLNIAVSRTEFICINNVAECVVMGCERTGMASNWKVWSTVSTPTIYLIVVPMEALGLELICCVVWLWRLKANAGRNNWICWKLHFGDLHDCN